MKNISIIIATYNADKVLQRCLNSIRPQKTEEIELLIIDGNSKDKTMEIVNNNKDIIDYAVSEPDKGIYDAWNKGIKASTGEWIQFLGADDELTPNAIETYLRHVKEEANSAIDIISGKAYLINRKGKIIGTFGKPLVWNELRHNMFISHGSTLHNRTFVKKNGSFSLDYKTCADYEFFVRYGKNINARFINEYLIKFLIGGTSDSIAAIKETFLIRHKHKSVNQLVNYYYFTKGVLGFYIRKLIKL